MNKNVLKLSALALLAGALFITSCKKEDTTAPIVTLSGSATESIELQSTWTDAGATAEDDEDGNITSQIVTSGTVDVNKTGSYTITYSVKDAAGNEGSATRTVVVYNRADYLAGYYHNCLDACTSGNYVYDSSMVTASTTQNGKFTISNFGGFGNNIVINASVDAAGVIAIVPVIQSLGGTASILNTGTCQVTSATAPTEFSIMYVWTDGSSNETCTSTYKR